MIGWREDWRFSEYRRSMGWAWYPASFFIAYVSQHLMLVGLTAPFWAVHRSAAALNALDLFAAIMCIAGICIAWRADNELHTFMRVRHGRFCTTPARHSHGDGMRSRTSASG
jgi:steroid 5-alpha reductase family enzyme